ncbi:hypothetical protein DV736_g3295, partial [Chaetothyriales sp. CBS 134916]
MPFATVNNHQLHYTDLAPSVSAASPTAPTSPTLIFVHGLGSSQNYFFPILPYLAAYRRILFDNYNAGRSQSDGGDTSIGSIGQDVLALLDHLHVDKAVVIGYSMGAIVPTYIASTSPERVVAGVLIGPVHPTEAVAQVFDKRIPVVSEQGIEAMANTIPVAATGSKATPLHRAFIREMLLGQNAEGYIANCKAIKTATPPDYAKVTVPILIIAGEEDKSAPLVGVHKIYQDLGSSDKKIEVLKGVGHWHAVESPDQVGPLIKAFVDRQSSHELKH